MTDTQELTPEEYEARIPPRCKLRTAEQHYKVLLWCWGVFTNDPDFDCGDCEYAREENDGD